MPDGEEVDEQLLAVLNEVLDAVCQARQAAWSAATSPVRDDLQELVSYLIDQSGRSMVAEERIRRPFDRCRLADGLEVRIRRLRAMRTDRRD